MPLGSHLRELWNHKLGLTLALVLALVVAFTSVYRVGLFPPSVASRGLEIGVASTSVLIDTPHSKLVDLNAQSGDFAALTVRADLLGNVMASYPVRAYIGRAARVNPTQIQATAPITASVPRALVEPGSGESAADIAATPDHYKLQIQADPTVPILHIYTQAPSAEKAVNMADASVRGLQTYLNAVAARQHIPVKDRVRLQSFGGAQGGVTNSGIAIQIAVLAFVVVFALACCVVLFVGRVRRGWAVAGRTPRTEP